MSKKVVLYLNDGTITKVDHSEKLMKYLETPDCETCPMASVGRATSGMLCMFCPEKMLHSWEVEDE